MIWRSYVNSRIAQVVDFLTALLGFLLSYLAWGQMWRINPFLPYIIPPQYFLGAGYYAFCLLFSLLFVFILNFHKAYSYQRFTSLAKEYWIILKASLIVLVFGVSIIYLLGFKEIPRTIYLLSFSILLLLFIVQKTFLFYLAAHLRRKGHDRKKVLLIGTGHRARHFVETIRHNFAWGLDIVGLLTGDREKVGKVFFGIKAIDSIHNIEQVLKSVNPEEVIITISTRRFDQIRHILEICEREGVQVRLNSDFFGLITKKVIIDNVYGLSIISFYMVGHTQLELIVKRIIDVLGALVGLLVFSPFMLAAAVGIWLSDGLPVFYSWNVIGLNKKPFKSWKFRTMVRNADSVKKQLMANNEMDGPVFKIKKDPRILPFGRWLRKFSIDETPQLFSVLIGDMSLVGPRPALPHEVEKFESWHRRKFSVKPGITCLWQVSGRNKISRFDDWVKLDLKYIDNWSLWLDLKILFKTVFVVVAGKGAS